MILIFSRYPDAILEIESRKMSSKRKEAKRKRKKGGENKRMCSQKTWSDQTHAMADKSAQPEKMIPVDRVRTMDPTTNLRAICCVNGKTSALLEAAVQRIKIRPPTGSS